MQGLSVVFAAIPPHPAGLLLAGAVVAVGCSIWLAVSVLIDRQGSSEWELALGGAITAAVLGLAGLALVALGAPAFR
jgi:hypothetical protein